MKRQKRLSHAKHNHDLCKEIHSKGGYADWVITTAFYSALHFVSYRIFPIKQKDSNGNSFELKTLDEYYRFKKLDCGKHPALADLVFSHFPQISPEYNWLMDICQKARYHNYQMSHDEGKKAIELLELIKANVVPKEDQ